MPERLLVYQGSYDQTFTVCEPGDHDWCEGDNDAVYCSRCQGYECGTCGATGRVARGLGTTKCYACSGWQVVFWWESDGQFINPYNAAKATASKDWATAFQPEARDA